MLEEFSGHSTEDIENSITNTLVIKREDVTAELYKQVCVTISLCIISFLLIIALVYFLIKVIFK